MYGGRTVFRVVPWIRISIAMVALGSAAAAAYFHSEEGLTWIAAFFIGFSIFAVAGVVESFRTYIILSDTEIRFRETFRKSAISRKDIVKVTWEAGCGVSLLLADGTWTNLPDLGQNSQGLTNSIRAWLRDA